MNEANKFRGLLENAKSVLITSHTSPDPDAISSVLLLGTTLQKNFPNTKIVMALEEMPEGLDFLSGYDQLKFGNLLETLKIAEPELFIMLDAINFERCSRFEGQDIREFLKQRNIKIAIIDHHERVNADQATVYISHDSIATAQDIYETCFELLKLERPQGYGESTMVGIYSDSGGFVYNNPRHRATYKIVSDLIDEGISVESVKNKLNQYSFEHMEAIAEFVSNISKKTDHTYSFLKDEFVQDWQKNNKPLASLNTAAGFFVDDYIRNVAGIKWGYVAYLNPLAGEQTYSVSLRSESDSKDVSLVANALGGGGHKPSAGAKIHGIDLKDALSKVEQAISNT